jgi:hypothetical protein
MAVEGKAGAAPRDRYAELLVVVVVIAALVVGWGVKAGAESRVVHIEGTGFKASYGQNWVREQPKQPEVLKITDPGSGARFHTTITVSRLENAGPNQQVAMSLNQERASDRQLYQILGGETIQWRGRETYRNDFAYVYVSPDLLNPTVPVVLHGVDYVFQHGSAIYVITCLADESVYDQAWGQFERFLRVFTPV